MSKAAQGFSPEAYFKYVEGGNPRRTPLIIKIAIYGWKLSDVAVYIMGSFDPELVYHLTNAISISEIQVNFIYGMQPFICVGVSINIQNVSLAQFYQKLSENDPLHGFVDLV